MEHARLSPSSSHRWSTCTASVRAIESAIDKGIIPEDTSNDAADEGVAAHQVRAECLDLGLDPFDCIGSKFRVRDKLWEVTHETAEYLAKGIDWIEERRTPGEIFIVEKRV